MAGNSKPFPPGGGLITPTRYPRPLLSVESKSKSCELPVTTKADQMQLLAQYNTQPQARKNYHRRCMRERKERQRPNGREESEVTTSRPTTLTNPPSLPVRASDPSSAFIGRIQPRPLVLLINTQSMHQRKETTTTPSGQPDCAGASPIAAEDVPTLACGSSGLERTRVRVVRRPSSGEGGGGPKARGGRI